MQTCKKNNHKQGSPLATTKPKYSTRNIHYYIRLYAYIFNFVLFLVFRFVQTNKEENQFGIVKNVKRVKERVRIKKEWVCCFFLILGLLLRRVACHFDSFLNWNANATDPVCVVRAGGNCYYIDKHKKYAVIGHKFD